MQADRQTDWFGMTHDEEVVWSDFKLQSGVPAYLEVKIDPLAHGPDAVGPIERTVTVVLADKQQVSVQLAANLVK